MSEMRRIKFGVRVPIFKNAGILVGYVEAADAAKIGSAVKVIREILLNSGLRKLADRIVYEQG